MALSADDIQELEYSLKRMYSVSTVFAMRSEGALDAKFSLFAQLLDLYIRGCEVAVKQGVDYKNSGIVLDSDDSAKVQELVAKIFKEGSASASDAE